MLLITCALGVHADDSIKVSASDLKALIERVERLERKDSLSQEMGTAVYGQESKVDSRKSKVESQESKVESQKSKAERRGKFTIGGYGEVTAKHCFYSNNYLRYGKNPEKYAGDHYGEFDLPHVVINMGYDFGYGWSMGTEIEFEHGGTESAIEIEEEEGGEYEGEIERGGEVALEQFWLRI